ncbi:MAG: membrane-bound lytic murein transglycosylase MltF [Pseudomonadales bacterium]
MFKLSRHKHARNWLPPVAWRRMRALCVTGALLCVGGLAYQIALLNRIDSDVAKIASVDDDDTLDVVTRVGPNTYFESDGGPNGFEFALLEKFASAQGKRLVVHTADSLGGLFEALNTGAAEIASAGLTPTAQREQRYLFSDAYYESHPIVVYRVGTSRPRKHSDLLGRKLVVVADSSHSSALSDLQSSMPELQWREVDTVDFTQLLAMVEQGVVDHTIIDSTEFTLRQGSFPSLKRAYDFDEQHSFNWMFPKTVPGVRLQAQADKFLAEMRESGTLARLHERFFGQSDNIGQVAANEFDKNMRARLPRYIDAIKQVAGEHDLDWRLLAAISYQESSWNPRAISPTGVRGMMMLTRPTARELGIKNRLDIYASLRGGATYYQRLKARLPDRIAEPDKSWFALAAYNVGMGHLEDARRLTQQLGMNPDSWLHVKESLPLLAEPEWYKKTRFGYARGHEPVNYVQRIRHFYNVLVWRDLNDKQNALAMRDDWRELLGEDWFEKPAEVKPAPRQASAKLPARATLDSTTSTLASAADALSVEGLAEPTNAL